MRHRFRNGLRGFLLLESQVFDDRGRWRAAPGWSEGAFAGLDEATREAARRAYEMRCTRLGRRWATRRAWTRLLLVALATLAVLAFVPSRAPQIVLLIIIGIGLITDVRTARRLT